MRWGVRLLAHSEPARQNKLVQYTKSVFISKKQNKKTPNNLPLLRDAAILNFVHKCLIPSPNYSCNPSYFPVGSN